MTMLVAWVVTGLLVGAVEGALRWRGGSSALAVLDCAALTAVAAAALGGIAVAVQHAARGLGIGRAPLALDDDARHRRQALATSAIAGAIVLGYGVRALAARTWLFEEESFAVSMVAGGAVIAVALVCGALLIALEPMTRAISWLDHRTPLWSRRWSPLRYAVGLAVPVWFFVGRFAWEHLDLLGQNTAIALWYGSLGLSVPIAYKLLARVSRPRVTQVAAATLAAFAALVAATLVTYRPDVGIAHGAGAALGVDIVHQLGDVDGDGASNLLGENDCRAFDRTRGPRARDIPDNGIDENCDGRDASARARMSVAPQRTYYDALAPGQIRHYNVVWLIVDAVRADHTSLLGYERHTTPALEHLANTAMVFSHTRSQASRTFFSLPSMFTGLNPGGMNWVHDGKMQQPSADHVTMAQRLSDAGYHTGVVLPGGMHKDYLGLQRGFHDRVSYFPDSRWKFWRERAAPLTTARSIELIDKWSSSDQPFFLTAHYIDPHNPYTVHPEVALAADARQTKGTTRAGRFYAYDQEIAYADRYIGFLLDYLESKPALWDNTIVIVTSDHGEEFHEHKHRFHGFSCHRETVEVPLVVRVPGLPAKRVGADVGLIDIVPTLIELLGLERANNLDGQSLLVGALDPAPQPERAFFCTTASMRGRKFLERAVRRGRYGLHLSVHNGEMRLYDAVSDPNERANLIAHPPADADVESLVELLRRSGTGNLQDHY